MYILYSSCNEHEAHKGDWRLVYFAMSEAGFHKIGAHSAMQLRLQQGYEFTTFKLQAQPEHDHRALRYVRPSDFPSIFVSYGRAGRVHETQEHVGQAIPRGRCGPASDSTHFYEG